MVMVLMKCIVGLVLIVREVKGKTNVSLKDIKVMRHKLALRRYKIRQGKLKV